MGRTLHHAIIVTAPLREYIERAKDTAREVFGGWIPDPFPAPINGVWTLCIGPDGSNEGWPESDKGDEQRKAFLSWLEAQRYEDGSSSLKWVEVSYGGDEREPARVLTDESQRRWPNVVSVPPAERARLLEGTWTPPREP